MATGEHHCERAQYPREQRGDHSEFGLRIHWLKIVSLQVQFAYVVDRGGGKPICAVLAVLAGECVRYAVALSPAGGQAERG